MARSHNWLHPFRLHAALIVVASLSLCALAILVIEDVLRRTDETLLREATQQCSAAARELLAQYGARQESTMEDEPETLPFVALDLSLRGLATTVLNSHEGIHGAYVLPPSDGIVGYSRPEAEADLSPRELTYLHELADRAAVDPGGSAVDVFGGEDSSRIVMVALHEPNNNAVAVTARRMSAMTPAVTARQWWLALLMLCAVIGLAGVISISVRLGRGVRSVAEGVARLEGDFNYRLPQSGAEFQSIVDAVNRMADRRKRLEASIRRQDRLAALGRVVSGVAHEIRNPLNGIRLSMELLARRVQNGTASAAEVNAAIREVDRLERILSRFLNFGRLGKEERQVQPVAPIVERAAHLLEEQVHHKGVMLHTEICDSGAEADVDALELEQVVMNLLLNALDVSERGSTISLRAGVVGDSVRVAVRDAGPGVAAHAREHLFDPYFTTKANGNGLGLALARDVILRHGGAIDFESSSGGTTFWFELPVARREVSA